MPKETSEPKATIFTDRKEALIASVGDKRGFFLTEIGDTTHYTLANTEHQANIELARQVFATKKLNRQELHELMAAQLAGGDTECEDVDNTEKQQGQDSTPMRLQSR